MKLKQDIIDELTKYGTSIGLTEIKDSFGKTSSLHLIVNENKHCSILAFGRHSIVLWPKYDFNTSNADGSITLLNLGDYHEFKYLYFDNMDEVYIKARIKEIVRKFEMFRNTIDYIDERTTGVNNEH